MPEILSSVQYVYEYPIADRMDFSEISSPAFPRGLLPLLEVFYTPLQISENSRSPFKETTANLLKTVTPGLSRDGYLDGFPPGLERASPPSTTARAYGKIRSL